MQFKMCHIVICLPGKYHMIPVTKMLNMFLNGLSTYLSYFPLCCMGRCTFSTEMVTALDITRNVHFFFFFALL